MAVVHSELAAESTLPASSERTGASEGTGARVQVWPAPVRRTVAFVAPRVWSGHGLLLGANVLEPHNDVVETLGPLHEHAAEPTCGLLQRGHD